MTNILQVTNDKDITFNVVLSKNEDNKTFFKGLSLGK